MRTINIKNPARLGDCIFTINILNKIVKINDVIFNYYIIQDFVNEIKEHVEDSKRINVIGCKNDIETNAIDGYQMWFGWIMYNSNPVQHLFTQYYEQGIYNPFFIKFYTKFCEDLNLKNPIKTVDDTLYDNKKLFEKNELCYEHDYLLINSKPFSGQYSNFDFTEFENLAKTLLDNGNKIITVNDVGFGIPNIVDLKFNLTQLGAISLYSKNIIGISTAPMIPCTNIHNKNSNISILICYNLNIPHVKTFDNIKKILI